MQFISTSILPAPIGATGTNDAIHVDFGLKCCPSMDLIAIFPKTVPNEKAFDALTAKQDAEDNLYGTDDDDLLIQVYRLSGEKVFTVAIDSDNGTIHVMDAVWRDDGTMLAIVTSDNLIRLINTFSGKIVHTYSSVHDFPEDKASTPKRKATESKGQQSKRRKCLPTSSSYTTHFTDAIGARADLDTAKEEQGTTLDDLLSLNADIEQLLKVKSNLPRDLAGIDVEQFLPRLATLPTNGMGYDDVFSTRTSIDAMFHPEKQSAVSLSTNVVAVAQTGSFVHMRVYDSFEVGDIDLNQSLGLPNGVRIDEIRQTVAHPLSHKLYIIASIKPLKPLMRGGTTKPDSYDELHLISLDLRFLRRSTLTLPILASKATQLHNLMRYLAQIEAQLSREVKTAFDLPGRFINSLETDLKEQDGDDSTFETAAYHVLFTGQVHGKFKEWLVDVLAERGVKRWDKAVYDCLELIRQLINENWGHAVERAGIVVSRLEGIAAADDAFGIDPHVLKGLQDTIDVMAIVGEDLLKDTNLELSGFNAFIKWLRKEVEMANLEDTSEQLDEMRENSDFSDVKKVTKYISERLRHTSVKKYIYEPAQQNTADLLDRNLSEHTDFLEQFLKARARHDQDTVYSLKSLTSLLATQCDHLFQQVASRLQQGVLVEYEGKIENTSGLQVCDSRIVWEAEFAVMYVVGKHMNSPTTLSIHGSTLEIPEPGHQSSRTSYKIEDIKSILDIKIVDDDQTLVLAATTSGTRIISLNLQGASQQSIRHEFGGQEDAFTKAGLQAQRMEVNGRKGRRTVTILDEHGRGYSVFDLDSIDDEARDDEAMLLDS